VVRIQVPPLRERTKDIPLLIDAFVDHFRRALGKSVRGITSEAYAHLTSYPWPGNVRELENVIERAMILAKREVIGIEDLPPSITIPRPHSSSRESYPELSLRHAKRQMEERLIRNALEETSGNRTHAAKLLGISHRSLLYKLKEYRIREFK